MIITEREFFVRGVRFSAQENGTEVGRAYLYLPHNDLHDRPFGLLEDVFVEPDSRRGGLGNALVRDTVIERARREQCYKLIATSRNGPERARVHEWYKRLGFKEYGVEFRMDF